MAEASIFVMKEVSSKVALWRANSHHSSRGVRLQDLHELFRVLHGNKQVINMCAHMLMFVTGISQPNIRVCKRGHKLEGMECVRDFLWNQALLLWRPQSPFCTVTACSRVQSHVNHGFNPHEE